MRPSQLYFRILTKILQFKAKRPTPLFVSYNVTSRCNMRCSFCDWWKSNIPELPTKKALAVIDEVCSLGIPFFDLSGGEPLLRKDLLILAKKASSHGCLVSMNTNGTLLKSHTVPKIADVFDVVVVSLDGPEEIHDRMRGVPGTYDKAINTLKVLKAHGVRIGINSIVAPWNIEILPKFIDGLRSIVDFAQLQPIHPYPPPPKNRPSRDAVSILSNYLLRLKKSDPSFLAVPKSFINGFEMFFMNKAPKICHAGGLYVAIDPRGRLLACPARSDIMLGNLFKEPIRMILAEKQSEGWREVSLCKGCWLECTVGVSILLENLIREAPDFIRIWGSV